MNLHSRMAQRGAAIIIAVVAVTLVGLALAAMTSLFAAEYKRTRSDIARAQVRQLLIAAASHVRNQLASGGDGLQVTLPLELRDRGAQASVAFDANTELDVTIVTINASVADQRGRQIITFRLEREQWRAFSARRVF